MEITKISRWLTKTDDNFPKNVILLKHRGYGVKVLARGVFSHPMDARFWKKCKENSLNLLQFYGKTCLLDGQFSTSGYKSLYGVHLIRMRICKWLLFQCTSASCNCQHWFIVHWVRRGMGRSLTLLLYSGCFFLFELLALQTIETLHPPLSYHLLPTNLHQGNESQRVQLPHGSIDDMTTKVITQHLTAPSKLIRLKLWQWRSQLRWQKKKPVFVVLTFKFYLQF